MKSEKAESIIRSGEWMDDETGERAVYVRRAYEALEVAEQEAEERMREELTRWHEPQEQPDDGCICLLRFRSNGFFVHYEGGIFTKKDGEWHDSQNMFTYNRDVILAWRPMHDNEATNR